PPLRPSAPARRRPPPPRGRRGHRRRRPAQERPHSFRPAGSTHRSLEEWIRTRLTSGDTLERITAEVQEEVIRTAALLRDEAALAAPSRSRCGVPEVGPGSLTSDDR